MKWDKDWKINAGVIGVVVLAVIALVLAIDWFFWRLWMLVVPYFFPNAGEQWQHPDFWMFVAGMLVIGCFRMVILRKKD